MAGVGAEAGDQSSQETGGWAGCVTWGSGMCSGSMDTGGLEGLQHEPWRRGLLQHGLWLKCWIMRVLQNWNSEYCKAESRCRGWNRDSHSVGIDRWMEVTGIAKNKTLRLKVVRDTFQVQWVDKDSRTGTGWMLALGSRDYVVPGNGESWWTGDQWWSCCLLGPQWGTPVYLCITIMKIINQ